nr:MULTISPECIES: hypothetical protein [unclassified Streptomyces]
MSRVTASSVDLGAVVRVDTPGEADHYRSGGVPQYALCGPSR